MLQEWTLLWLLSFCRRLDQVNGTRGWRLGVWGLGWSWARPEALGAGARGRWWTPARTWSSLRVSWKFSWVILSFLASVALAPDEPSWAQVGLALCVASRGCPQVPPVTCGCLNSFSWICLLLPALSLAVTCAPHSINVLTSPSCYHVPNPFTSLRPHYHSCGPFVCINTQPHPLGSILLPKELFGIILSFVQCPSPLKSDLINSLTVFFWEIPWSEGPGGLQTVGSRESPMGSPFSD